MNHSPPSQSSMKIAAHHFFLQALDCSALDLTNCGLRPQDAQALAACFPANSTCTSVLLDNNRMGDVGMAAILQVHYAFFVWSASVTTTMPKLKQLSRFETICCFGVLFVNAASQALAENTRITALSSSYPPPYSSFRSTETIFWQLQWRHRTLRRGAQEFWRQEQQVPGTTHPSPTFSQPNTMSMTVC